MTPSSPRQLRPRQRPEPEQTSVLDELLCIDGVTDLTVYRLLTGRGEELFDVPPPPRPAVTDGQLPLFPVLLCGGGDAAL